MPISPAGNWQNNLEGLVLIIYILVVHVFRWRLRNQAIQAFRPLLPLDEDDFNRLAAEVDTPKRRWEWISVLIGVGLVVGLGQPWNLPAVRGQVGGMERLSSTITSWGAYQRLAQDAPAWPINASIIRRLAASIFVPAIVYLAKILSGLGLRF